MTFKINIISLFALCFLFFACDKDEQTNTPEEQVIEEIPSFSFDINYDEENFAVLFPDFKPIQSSFSATWEDGGQVTIDTLNDIQTFQSADMGAYWLSDGTDDGTLISAIDYSVSDSLTLSFILTDQAISSPKRFQIASGDLLNDILDALFSGESELNLPPGVAIPIFNTFDENTNFPLYTLFGVLNFADTDYIEIESFDEATNKISGSFEINFSMSEDVEIEEGADGENFFQITNGKFNGVPLGMFQ